MLILNQWRRSLRILACVSCKFALYNLDSLRARKAREGTRENHRAVETRRGCRQERERERETRTEEGRERREYRTIVYQRLKQTHRRRWLWSAGLIYRVRRPRPRVPMPSYPFPLRASRRASSSARIDTREKPCTEEEEEEALQPFYGPDFASRAKHVLPRWGNLEADNIRRGGKFERGKEGWSLRGDSRNVPRVFSAILVHGIGD